MVILLSNSELKATVNSELYLVDNELMKYIEYAARFKRAWKESDAPAKSQKELAKLLDCSQATVSDWINGEKLPSMDTALAISKKLNCCVEWLLTGNGPKYPGEESSIQHYINVTGITDDQRELVTQMIAQFVKNNPENENKTLTETKDIAIGGG